MSSPKTVGVLGGGRWGLALARAASAAGNPVLLCTRREPEALPKDVELTGELSELGKRTTLIIMAVPSVAARAVSSALGDVIDGHHCVVHATRGLSGEGLTPISQLVREETPTRKVGALAGPVLADELLEGSPSVIAVGSRYPEVLSAVQMALGSNTLRVSETADLTGLEWASALMGALLVGLGYARASGIRPALLSGLITRGVQEAAQIGVAAGGEERTFYGVAGYGDLFAGMGQLESRPEVRFGEALAETGELAAAFKRVGITRIEAPELVPRVVSFARERGLSVNVFYAMGEVFAGRTTKEQVMANLMRREHRKR